MIFLIFRIVLVLFITLQVGSVSSDGGLRFGLVAKSLDDQNFVDAGLGCAEEARKHGDQCLLFGPRGSSNPRDQVEVIKRVLREQSLDAVAISVTKSDLLADVLRAQSLPIIAFDSPFDPAHTHLSRTYVGTDNLEYGRELARVVKRFRPQGGTICLMSAMHDVNLGRRVLGVRRELSNDSNFPDGMRLSGEGGWFEADRCPWNASDNIDRSLTQLEVTFRVIKPDVFVSVGSWPFRDSVRYRKMIEPFLEDIITQRRLVITAGGPLLLTHTGLMNQKLIHAFVINNFPEVGRESYRYMKAALEGEMLPPTVYVPTLVWVAE